ncbi:MAG: hypothetical protein AB1791_15660 [Chloroflexota bacterium]
MRTTQTYVLRLLVDRDEPAALRGVIRCVATGEELSFTDEQSLLTTLLTLLKGNMAARAEEVSKWPTER